MAMQAHPPLGPLLEHLPHHRRRPHRCRSLRDHRDAEDWQGRLNAWADTELDTAKASEARAVITELLEQLARLDEQAVAEGHGWATNLRADAPGPQRRRSVEVGDWCPGCCELFEESDHGFEGW